MISYPIFPSSSPASTSSHSPSNYQPRPQRKTRPSPTADSLLPLVGIGIYAPRPATASSTSSPRRARPPPIITAPKSRSSTTPQTPPGCGCGAMRRRWRSCCFRSPWRCWCQLVGSWWLCNLPGVMGEWVCGRGGCEIVQVVHGKFLRVWVGGGDDEVLRLL